MSVAALQPTAVVFREEQNFAWWVYALLGASTLLLGAGLYWKSGASVLSLQSWGLGIPLILGVGLAVPAALVIFLLRMTTEVAPTSCVVWFGWVPTYRQAISLAQIQRIEVVTYRPLRDYGGWGVRCGRDGERVLNARGNQGVRLVMADGSRLLIGSQRPEELAQAIDEARRATA